MFPKYEYVKTKQVFKRHEVLGDQLQKSIEAKLTKLPDGVTRGSVANRDDGAVGSDSYLIPVFRVTQSKAYTYTSARV